MNRTVLVTGGAGYIGSHTCKMLAANGWLPVTYDNLQTGHAEAVKWGPLEHGDIRDTPRLDAVLETHRPQAIIHFAASTYVGESHANPGKYYQNNVTGSLSLLDAARRAGIGRIVFSSSCATYGVCQGATLDEQHPQAPINPYGFTKLVVESRLYKDSGDINMQDILDRASTILGRPVPFRDAGRRPGDPAILVSKAQLIRTELGWQPCHSDIDNILRTALKWFQRGA